MAKRKHDDFEFGAGEEYFPIDDYNFDDLDNFESLMGEDDKSNAKGIKGFFKNSAKSVKNLATDLTNNYLPEVSNLSNQLSTAKMEMTSKISEIREQLVEKRAKMKEGASKVSLKGMGKDALDEAKSKFADLKKGKFYGKKDESFDMDGMFDDEGAEEEDKGNAKQSKVSNKYKAKKIVTVKAGMSKSDMADIASTQITAQAKIQNGIYKRQLLVGEQHFSAQMAIFSNIADNIYTITKFLSKEGMVNLSSSLEYNAKSLAFIQDQTALLKEIRNAQVMLLGKANEEETEWHMGDDKSIQEKIFGSGFDLTEYGKLIGSNARNMFDTSMIGSAYGMYKMQNDMSGMMGGKKKSLLSTGLGLVKDNLLDSLMSGKTKMGLDKLNTLVGGMPGAMVSKFNRMANNSSNPIISFMGQLLGLDETLSKSTNLGLTDPRKVTPFDAQTHKTINDVIPDILEDIRSSLTGEEKRSFDYTQGIFKKHSTIKRQLARAEEDDFRSNVYFSTSADSILTRGLETRVKDKGYKKLTESEISSGFNKILKNISMANQEFNPDTLTSPENENYREIIFAGISNPQIKTLFMKSAPVLKEDPETLAMFNASKWETGSRVTRGVKDRLKNMSASGGGILAGQINMANNAEHLLNQKLSRWADPSKHQKGSKAYLNAKARELEINDALADLGYMGREGTSGMSDEERADFEARSHAEELMEIRKEKLSQKMSDKSALLPGGFEKLVLGNPLDKLGRKAVDIGFSGISKLLGFNISSEGSYSQELKNMIAEQNLYNKNKGSKVDNALMGFINNNKDSTGFKGNLAKGLGFIGDKATSIGNTAKKIGKETKESGKLFVKDFKNELNSDANFQALKEQYDTVHGKVKNFAKDLVSKGKGKDIYEGIKYSLNPPTAVVATFGSLTIENLNIISNNRFKVVKAVDYETHAVLLGDNGKIPNEYNSVIKEEFIPVIRGNKAIKEYLLGGFVDKNIERMTKLEDRLDKESKILASKEAKQAEKNYKDSQKSNATAKPAGITGQIKTESPSGVSSGKVINKSYYSMGGGTVSAATDITPITTRLDTLIDILKGTLDVRVKGGVEELDTKSSGKNIQKKKKRRGIVGTAARGLFKLASVPFALAGGLLGGLVSAPFKLLGSAFNTITGRNKKLSPKEKEKLAKMKEKTNYQKEMAKEKDKQRKLAKKGKRGFIGSAISGAGNLIKGGAGFVGRGLKGAGSLAGKAISGAGSVIKGGAEGLGALLRSSGGLGGMLIGGGLGLAKGVLTGATSLITGTSHAQRVQVSSLKKEYDAKGELMFSRMTLDEAKARLAGLLNKPIEELDGLDLVSAKTQLRGFASGTIKIGRGALKGISNLIGKGKNNLAKLFGGSGTTEVGGVKINRGIGEELILNVIAIRKIMETSTGITSDIDKITRSPGTLAKVGMGAIAGASLIKNKLFTAKDAVAEGLVKATERTSKFIKSDGRITKARNFLKDRFGKVKNFFSGTKDKTEEFLNLSDEEKMLLAREKTSKVRNKFSSIFPGLAMIGGAVGGIGKKITNRFKSRGVNNESIREGSYEDKVLDKQEAKKESRDEQQAQDISDMAKAITDRKDKKEKVVEKEGSGNNSSSPFDIIKAIPALIAAGLTVGIPALLAKRTSDKVKLVKQEWGEQTNMERAESIIGGSDSNFDSQGNPVDPSTKETRKFGLGSLNFSSFDNLSKLGGFASKGLAGLAGGLASKVSKIPIVGKLAGKAIGLGGKVASGITGGIGKAAGGVAGLMRGAVLNTVGKTAIGKAVLGGIGGFAQKHGVKSVGGLVVKGAVAGVKAAGGLVKKFLVKLVTNGSLGKFLGKHAPKLVNFIVTKLGPKSVAIAGARITADTVAAGATLGASLLLKLAQAGIDFGTGWNRVSRWFKLGKGIKPTTAMRITAGAVNALSGQLYGLLPAEAVTKFIFNLVGGDSKAELERGREFDRSRAKILGLPADADRLAEYETRSWFEKLQGAGKAAKILGFGTDKESKGIYKKWLSDKYKPLDDELTTLKKQYKQTFKFDPTQVANSDEQKEVQEKFRSDYLKFAADYVRINNLEKLGPTLVPGEEFEEGNGMATASDADQDENSEFADSSVPSEEEEVLGDTSSLDSVDIPQEGSETLQGSVPAPTATAVPAPIAGIKDAVGGLLDNAASGITGIADNIANSGVGKAVTSVVSNIRSNPIGNTLLKIASYTPFGLAARGIQGLVNASRNRTNEATERRAAAGGADSSPDLFGAPSNGEILDTEINRKGSLYDFLNKLPNKKEERNQYALAKSLEVSRGIFDVAESGLNRNNFRAKMEASLGYYRRTTDTPGEQRRSFLASLGDKAREILSGIGNWAGDRIDDIREGASSLYNKGKEALGNVWNFITGNNGADSSSSSGRTLGPVGTTLQNAATAVANSSVGRAATAVYERVKTTLENIITGPRDAIAYFLSNTTRAQEDLDALISGNQLNAIRELAGKLRDVNALGQNRSLESLSSPFKERVQAFLASPEAVARGVRIREARRSPLTQFVYYLKGRLANNSFLNEMFRLAGFSGGAWDPTLKNTWTLGSKHFSGTAVDFEDNGRGVSFYQSIAPIAKKYGLAWGGDWAQKDYPHFEMPANDRAIGYTGPPTAFNTSQRGQNAMADAGYSVLDLFSGNNTTSNISSPARTGNINLGSRINTPTANFNRSSMTTTGIRPMGNMKISSPNVTLRESSTVTEARDMLSAVNMGLDLMNRIANEQVRHNQVSEGALNKTSMSLEMVIELLTQLNEYSKNTSSSISKQTEMSENQYKVSQRQLRDLPILNETHTGGNRTETQNHNKLAYGVG
jgi:hypothetical protein